GLAHRVCGAHVRVGAHQVGEGGRWSHGGAAESELRRLGLEDLRVHHHGDLARVEAPQAELPVVASEPLRGEVLRAVRSAGFRLVALDLGTPADPGT
ncbi:hypothetical protein ACWFQT_18000, partial [Cellulosimicrobium cellulans]